MKPEEIKEMIGIAQESVEGIKDQKLRNQTYEIVLSNLMNKQKSIGPTEITKDDDSNTPTNEKIKKGPAAVIADKFGIDVEKVEDYFEFDDKNIEILCPISLNSSAEEHLYFALILLTLNKIAFDEREIDSGNLRAAAKLKGIKSLVNLSTNLKKCPEYIIHKHGKVGSTNSTYKLTLEGYGKGIEIIKDILDGKSLVQECGPDKPLKKRKRSSGLTKELYELCRGGFFDSSKNIKDVQVELNKRGFTHNTTQDISSVIIKVLMKNKKLLTREEKEGVWHYATRK